MSQKLKMSLVELKLALADQGLPVTVHTPGFQTAPGILRILADEGLVKCVHSVPWGIFSRDVTTEIHAKDLNRPSLKLGWRLQRFVDEQSGRSIDASDTATFNRQASAASTASISSSGGGGGGGSIAARSLSLVSGNALLDLTFADVTQRDQVFDVLMGVWEDCRPAEAAEPTRRIILALQGKNLTKQIAREEAALAAGEDPSEIGGGGLGRAHAPSEKAWSREALSDAEVARAIKELSSGALVTEWVDSMMGIVTTTEKRLLRFDLDAECVIIEPVVPTDADSFKLASVFGGSRDDAAVVLPVKDLQRVGVHGRASALTTRLIERTEGKPALRSRSFSLVFSSQSINITAASEREVARLARFFNMAREGKLVHPLDETGETEGHDGDDAAGGEDWASALKAAGAMGGKPRRAQPASGGKFKLPSPKKGGGGGGGEDGEDEESDDELDPSCSWVSTVPQSDPEASLEAKLAKAMALKGPAAPKAPGAAAAVDPNPRRRSAPQMVENGHPTA